MKAIKYLKKFKAITPSLRSKVSFNSSLLTSYKPLKRARFKILTKSGRNSSGKITVYNKANFKKYLYRKKLISASSNIFIVTSVEKNSKSFSLLCRVFNLFDKNFYYTPFTENIYPGCLIFSNYNQLGYKPGSRYLINELPNGSLISHISLSFFKKPILTSSTGSNSLLLHKNDLNSIIRVSSGKVFQLENNAACYLGGSGFNNSNQQQLGKAGKSYYLGKRPKVRGVAMNPVDHPHGGGEGKTSGGRPSVTPWGRPTKGKPTKKKTKKSLFNTKFIQNISA